MSEKAKRTERVAPLVSVGLSIQRARKKRRMTVDKLAKVTRISSRYINEMESGNFASIPGKVYVLGFTNTVSKELGLDEREILEVVKSELYGNARIDSQSLAPCSVSPRSIGAALARILGLSRDRHRDPEVVTYSS